VLRSGSGQKLNVKRQNLKGNSINYIILENFYHSFLIFSNIKSGSNFLFFHIPAAFSQTKGNDLF
jgi:hypothetical protein